MTSLLVIELTAATGDLGLLANNGIVSLAWISIRPWLVNALSRVSKTSLFLLLLRVNRAMVTNGRIGIRQGCMGLSHNNEYHYRPYEQQNQGFMTGLKSYSVQTIYVTAVNVNESKQLFDLSASKFNKSSALRANAINSILFPCIENSCFILIECGINNV